MEFSSIKNSQNLSQIIKGQIEDAIRKKELGPGEKLPTEKEFCESFGVSRNVLREALRSLDSKGLIKIKKGSGMFVTEFTSKNAISSLNLFLELHYDNDQLYHILKIRKMFEPYIAEAACEGRTDEDLEKIEATLQDLIDCNPDDLEKEVEIDSKFHLLITQSTGNLVLPLILEPIFSLKPKIQKVIYGKKPITGRKEKTIYHHRAIFEAIRKREKGLAREFMREHILETERNYLKFFKK